MLTGKLGCRLPRRVRELLGDDANFRVELERFRTELRPVFVVQFVFGVAWFIILAVFVPYAVRRFGLTASGVGLVEIYNVTTSQ